MAARSLPRRSEQAPKGSCVELAPVLSLRQRRFAAMSVAKLERGRGVGGIIFLGLSLAVALAFYIALLRRMRPMPISHRITDKRLQVYAFVAHGAMMP